MNPTTTTQGSSLHHLGHTRSRRALDHLLQTPDTFVWAPLPGMKNATACVHTAPQLGAAFAQYTVAFEPGGSWQTAASTSRFVYVLSGELRNSTGPAPLQADDFLYLPPSSPAHFTSNTGATIVVIQKPYQSLDGSTQPTLISGTTTTIAPTPLLGDASIQVRSLLPADPAYDMAVNTMTYRPGARLSMVEVHVMEHGLLMLEGEGIYRLGDSWYPVAAGDFIWMAPFCPQWFGALGPAPSRYLIYKDWNRAPFTAASNTER